jgi:hypothetical protein
MLHTINVVECALVLVLIYLLLSVMPYVDVMCVLWSWFLLYVWGWGVCCHSVFTCNVSDIGLYVSVNVSFMCCLLLQKQKTSEFDHGNFGEDFMEYSCTWECH